MPKISQLVKRVGYHDDLREEVVATVEGDGAALVEEAIRSNDAVERLKAEAQVLAAECLYEWPRFQVRTHELAGQRVSLADEERHVADLRKVRAAVAAEGWRLKLHMDSDGDFGPVYCSKSETVSQEDLAERLGVSALAIAAVIR
jgi:hypothetical protein